MAKRGRPIQDNLKCQFCKKPKPRDHFYDSAGSSTGKSNVCIGCNTEYVAVQSYKRILRTKGRAALVTMRDDYLKRVKAIQKILTSENVQK